MNNCLLMLSAATLLALALSSASQTVEAAETAASSSSLVATRSSAKRTLDEEEFDFGDWAEELWNNALDAVGLDNNNNNQDNNNNDNEIDWGTPDAWNDWFVGLLEDTEEAIEEISEFDVCTIIEAGIGIGSEFGAAANCVCEGDFGTGLQVSCSFENCWEFVAPAFEGTCSAVDLEFALGGPDGTVDVRACANSEGLEETCFTYQLDVSGDNNSIWPDQSCTATYGGQPCSCTIENGVFLSVDCSALLPGATFGTVREELLSTASREDVDSWFPEFDLAQLDFELTAGIVPWESLDLNNLDFDNFDIGAVNWGAIFDIDFEGAAFAEEDFGFDLESTWMDLLGDNPTFLDADQNLSDGVCTLMAQAVDLSEELGVDGSCECGYDDSTGVLALSCSFSETCVDNNNDNDVLGIDLPPLCGSVAMNLTYASLAEIYADVCVTYSDFPRICYSYGIPFAADPFPPDTINDGGDGIGPGDYMPPVDITIIDANNNNNDNAPDMTSPFSRDCSAKYGDDDPTLNNDCKCTIDSSFCVTVDCSAFAPMAATDGCQVVDLKGATESSRMVLDLATTQETVVSDESGNAVAEAQSSGGRPVEPSTVALAIAASVLGLAL